MHGDAQRVNAFRFVSVTAQWSLKVLPESLRAIGGDSFPFLPSMVRANVVTPAFTRSPPSETTKLLEEGSYLKKEAQPRRVSKNAGFAAIFGTTPAR